MKKPLGGAASSFRWGGEKAAMSTMSISRSAVMRKRPLDRSAL
jgi:hypothetical protein